MRCMWMYRRFFEDASSLPSFFDLNGKAIEQRTKEMNDLRDARKLAVITVVAVGYGGDMDEELADELLDDMDFDRYGKLKCPKIEQMLPKLMKMVERYGEYEIKSMVRSRQCRNICNYDMNIID